MSINRGTHKEAGVHIDDGLLHSRKKNEVMPSAATWMDLETVILSEVSQKEEEIFYNTPYMWNLKSNDTNELLYKTETDS